MRTNKIISLLITLLIRFIRSECPFSKLVECTTHENSHLRKDKLKGSMERMSRDYAGAPLALSASHLASHTLKLIEIIKVVY